ncbi:MFS transporter [Alicyclobacillus ferrooxydans]|uniref:Major facilitator superfamily (MFS) profile domain-containing protein n=1 Tax=Alicyclobacillus ferrooxydans TaxID=471514 RepID=A0A0N8PPI6_9BACL|nr:MFS transporter [Alicyclobacillus ferrooxydans]KPV44429.1 hypothetical protein AN477_07385 [Alicyclobacillus ferrooxydans]
MSDEAGYTECNGGVNASPTDGVKGSPTDGAKGSLIDGVKGSPTIQPGRLLSNRRYLFLMSAQAISNLGDWLYILALFVIVGFKWHGSPIVISVMMLCLTAPMVVLGTFTGMLADKWNRTTIMMVSNIVMAILVGVIPLLPQKWMLFVILILVGIFQSLFSPAESGKVKEIVPDEHMQQATSINQSIVQLTKIIGPGASGFLVAAFGSMSAFWLDSISFVLSTVLLIFTGFRAAAFRLPEAEPDRASDPEATPSTGTGTTPATEPVPSTETTPSTEPVPSTGVAAASTGTADPVKEKGRRGFMEGIDYIRKVRVLWAGTLILTLTLLFVQLTDAQIVTLIRTIPNASSSLMGMIMGLSGAGGLIAALLVGVIKWKSSIRLMGLGCIAMGIGFTATALVVQHGGMTGGITLLWMTVIVVLSIFIGMGAGFTFIPFSADAQKNTPVHLTGRVFGVIGSFTTGASLLGPALGGLVVTLIGVINAYMATGVLVLIMGIATYFGRRWLEGAQLVDPATSSEPHVLAK